MRYVKNGKVYDTDTATMCHKTTTDGSLYRSQKGTLFVVTLTMMGNLSKIVEFDEQAAAHWLEQREAPEESYQKAGIPLEEV